MTGIAPIVAARSARRQNEEEEDMAAYAKDDLEGWEFKIVRANTRKFRTTAAIQKLCAEEAQAGWELVEKFDDYRLRFKRRIEKRAGDQFARLDPYRTQVGIRAELLTLVILGAMAFALLAVLLIRQL